MGSVGRWRFAMNKLAILALPLLFVLPAAAAETGAEDAAQAHTQLPYDGIPFGNTLLHLGMSKEKVIAALADDFRLSRQKTGDWYVVTLHHAAVGTLNFANGQLTSVSKNWGPEKGFEFASRIYWALSEMGANNAGGCTIALANNDQPGASVKSVLITCNGKTLEIEALRTEKGVYAGDQPMPPADFGMITEWLR
jgi:hypothetical protein